jgi:phosphoglycolate phosphatase
MLPLRNIKAVAIDLDGTLLDTIDEIVIAANQLLAAHRVLPLPAEQIKSFVGKGIANLVKRVIEACALPLMLEQAVTQFESLYFDCLNTTTKPYDGVVDGLARLHAAGVPMLVATNKAMRFSQVLLDGQGIAHFFQAVYAGDTFTEKKPHPMMLQNIARDLNIKPAELLMIGDSANDVQAARNAGCPVVVVPYGYREGKSVESLNADAVYANLDEIAKLVTIQS